MDNRIAELRKEKGMTLKKLAEELNIRDNTLSQYETGKRSPQLGLLQEIANYFNVSIEYLTKYSDKRDYPINNNSEAIEILKRLKDEKEFTYMNLSLKTSIELKAWCIANKELLENEYPELLTTVSNFKENVTMEDEMIKIYSAKRFNLNSYMNDINSLLLDDDYNGAGAYHVLKFMKETERIGSKQTKELMKYIKTLPTEKSEIDK